MIVAQFRPTGRAGGSAQAVSAAGSLSGAPGLRPHCLQAAVAKPARDGEASTNRKQGDGASHAANDQ